MEGGPLSAQAKKSQLSMADEIVEAAVPKEDYSFFVEVRVQRRLFIFCGGLRTIAMLPYES
jgi:hypothetical protein